ncbi:MAG: NADH-quinone oxidoreductase subunit H [Firmicutes bacterium]|nr:NADH-quinone oxidoreductase subunit H [Bacillota bacterium]
MGRELFWLLVFPGLLFTAVVGCLVGVLDRKLSARFQFRVGPPWYQNIVDIFKLFGKETILIRENPTAVYVTAPLVALGSTMLAAAVLGGAVFFRVDIGGDLFFFVYLLLLFPVSLILGAFASGNVYAALGAGRESNLLLAYELPFCLSLLIPVVKTGYALRLTEIIARQATGGAVIGSVSGLLGFSVMLLCLQAKMGLVPFDLAEAETELAGGVLIEYSGPLLACWRLARQIQYVVLPLTAVALFLGGFSGPGALAYPVGVLKYLGVVFLMVVLKNTNPRVQVGKMLEFFWKPLSLLAALGVILAVAGV